MVPDMYNLADIPGNHTLRATGATELHTTGVPGKTFQEHTGHRTMECLRMYEHTSDKRVAVSLPLLKSPSSWK